MVCMFWPPFFFLDSSHRVILTGSNKKNIPSPVFFSSFFLFTCQFHKYKFHPRAPPFFSREFPSLSHIPSISELLHLSDTLRRYTPYPFFLFCFREKGSTILTYKCYFLFFSKFLSSSPSLPFITLQRIFFCCFLQVFQCIQPRASSPLFGVLFSSSFRFLPVSVVSPPLCKTSSSPTLFKLTDSSYLAVSMSQWFNNEGTLGTPP